MNIFGMFKWIFCFMFNQPVKASCGHEVSAYAEIEVETLDGLCTIRRANVPWRECLDCAKEKLRICPWCGEIIFPGMPITTYQWRRLQPLHKNAEKLNEHGSVLGCAKCADTVADICGSWNGKGVDRFESALERAVRTGQATSAEYEF